MRNQLLIAVAVVSCFLGQIALAIAPHDQRRSDAPIPLTIGATGLLNGLQSFGTGTVVGANLDEATGYVAILTARHVAVENPTNFFLGSGIGAQGYSLNFDTGAFATYRINDPVNNPNNLPVDVALMVGSIANLNPGSQELTAFNVLTNNVPTITAPADNPLLGASAANNVDFTELGYGFQGQWNAGVNGYQSNGVFGERQFQNNAANNVIAPALAPYQAPGGPFFEPLVTFAVAGPPRDRAVACPAIRADRSIRGAMRVSRTCSTGARVTSQSRSIFPTRFRPSSSGAHSSPA